MNLFATIVVASVVIAASVAVPANAPSPSSSANGIQGTIEFLSHRTSNLIFPPPDDSPEDVRLFRCYIRAYGEFDEKHSLGEGWAETKEQVVPLVDSLEKCTNILCSRPYHYRAADILDTYNDKLHKYNPEAQGVVADQISTQCYPGKISVLNAGIAKEYRCYISVTDKLAKKHNLGQIWVETKKQLHPIINELAKCEDNDCSYNESLRAWMVWDDFLMEVDKNNPKGYNAILEQVDKQCKNKQ